MVNLQNPSTVVVAVPKILPGTHWLPVVQSHPQVSSDFKAPSHLWTDDPGLLLWRKLKTPLTLAQFSESFLEIRLCPCLPLLSFNFRRDAASPRKATCCHAVSVGNASQANILNESGSQQSPIYAPQFPMFRQVLTYSCAWDQPTGMAKG